MKILIPNCHAGKNVVGGGWSFIRNLKDGADYKVIDSAVYEDCDGVLIASSTMTPKEVVHRAIEEGKKIVLRIDNMPRNSRNKGNGFSRLKGFYEKADVIVYQSEWARNYIEPFFKDIKKESVVILNGANRDIFKPEGARIERPKEKFVVLYSRHNRDETKRWEEAWFDYQKFHLIQETKPTLWIMGRFSPEQVQYNFDFFNGEEVLYHGDVQSPEQIATILRSVDILSLPYWNDACSNTLIEARLCGVPTIWQNDSGGNKEIMDASVEYLCAKRMAEDYGKLFKGE